MIVYIGITIVIFPQLHGLTLITIWFSFEFNLYLNHLSGSVQHCAKTTKHIGKTFVHDICKLKPRNLKASFSVKKTWVFPALGEMRKDGGDSGSRRNGPLTTRSIDWLIDWLRFVADRIMRPGAIISRLSRHVRLRLETDACLDSGHVSGADDSDEWTKRRTRQHRTTCSRWRPRSTVEYPV